VPARSVSPRARPITQPRLLLPALVIILVGSAVTLPTASASDAGGRVLRVAPLSSALAGSTGPSPLQAAVDAALPGDHIRLAAGTYEGQVVISRSGTAAAPITIEPDGSGPVTVTATFRAQLCDSSTPSVRRTFYSDNGSDYWTIQGLRIVNGVWLSGTNSNLVASWFHDKARTKDWQTRRSLPGRGTNDAVAAEAIYAALTTKVGVPVDPAEGWKILDNDISGRGVHATVTRGGELGGNTIHDVDCGVGPGAWLTTYSDAWAVHDNSVARIAPSTYRHYMQEGIRFGSASSYNLIERNVVSDLPGDGRGITTDIDASYNVFRNNSVLRTQMGFNDQQSGWENQWLHNTADAIRGPAFAFRGADAKLTAPSFNSSTYHAYVECNRVTNSIRPMTAGALMESTFVNNYFNKVTLSANLKTYWKQYNNRWNGSTELPPSSPPQPPAGSC